MLLADTRAQVRARPDYQWIVLGIVCLGTFMGALDGSIVNVTLPLLSTIFGVDIPTIGWVAIAYQLATISTLGTFGRLTDLFGRRVIYLSGFVVFVVSSALCGISNGATMLIAFRAMQGVGAAMLTANSMALITAVFPGNQRGTAIGFLETSVSLAFTIGPTIGGVLQSALGWRSIFYVTVPVALVGFILAFVVVNDPARLATGPRRRSLDLPGAVLLAISLTSVMLVLTGLAGDAASTYIWLALPAAIVVVIFIVVEKRTKDPTIDLGLFGIKTFAWANLAKLFSYTAMSSVTFLMPFYLQRSLGMSPTVTGLAMTSFPIALAIGSMTGGPLSDRFGSRLLAPIGMIIASLGGLILTRVLPADGYFLVGIALFLVGLGMGLFIVPNDSAIMGSAPTDKLGVASGILAISRTLGLSSGVAFAGTVLATRSVAYASLPVAAPVQFALAFHDVYGITIGLCVVAMVLSFFRGKTLHG